jgi:competence protein ComEC
MCLAVVGAKLLSLDVPAANGLALAALLLLVVRPLDIHDAGFQLSFAATGCILAFVGPLSRKLRLGLGRLGSPLALSLAAQAGVVPVLAWHFYRLTPVAVVASIVAMPIAAGLVVTGALLLVAAPVPWVGEGLARCVWLLVKGLTLCSQLAVAVPGGSLRVAHPGWFWACGYFLTLVVIFLSKGRLRRGMVVLLSALILALAVGPVPSRSPVLRLTALDVGHGDAVLLELPEGKRLLVDGGGSFGPGFDMGGSVVVPALLRQEVRSLDAVVLTHTDFDHLGGLPAIVSNLEVNEIWEGGPGWGVPGYRFLREKARASGIPIRRLRTGEGRSASLRERRKNQDSLVLRVSYGRSSILLTGDAGREIERQLVRSGKSLRADVLKVGHHGSRSSTTAAFLEAVQPRFAVVSTGYGSSYLPSARVMHRLRARGVTCLRTDLDGAVTLSLDKWGGIGVETFTSRR